MKKLALAALAALATLTPGGAIAQGSVNLFGTADVYIGTAKSGSQTIKRMAEGGLAASRLGFRGSEDLGGGLRANFLLEGGIALDTGAGTLPGPGFAFTRQALVGLSGQWGSVDLGRMYTPMFYTLFRADPFGLNAVFSPVNLVSATDAQASLSPFAARASNMLRYRTPSALPWFADVAVAAGEGALPKVYGATGGWMQGPLYLAYGVQKSEFGAARTTYQAVTGSYDFKLAKLAAHYIRNTSSLATVPVASLVGLSASVPVAEVSQLMFGLTRREVRGSARSQLAWTLGYDYHLSKRTALYGRALTLDNRSTASATLAQVPVVANSGDGVRVLAVGVRHNF